MKKKKKTLDESIAEEAESLKIKIEELQKEIDITSKEEKEIKKLEDYYRKKLKYLTSQDKNYQETLNNKEKYEELHRKLVVKLEGDIYDTNLKTGLKNLFKIKMSELNTLYGEQSRKKHYSYEIGGRPKIYTVTVTEDPVKLSDDILFKAKLKDEKKDFIPKYNEIANIMKNAEIKYIERKCKKDSPNKDIEKNCIVEHTIDIENHYNKEKNRIFNSNYITSPSTYLLRNNIKTIESEQPKELMKITPTELSVKYGTILSGNYIDELKSSNINDNFSCLIGDNIKIRKNNKNLDYRYLIENKCKFLEYLDDYERNQKIEKTNYQMEYKKPYPNVTKDGGFKLKIGEMIFNTNNLRKWVENTIESDIENKDTKELFDKNKPFLLISSKTGLFPLLMTNEDDKNENIICMMKPENEEKFLDIFADSIYLTPDILRSFDSRKIVKELTDLKKKKIGDY
jgi:hypothetical protein